MVTIQLEFDIRGGPGSETIGHYIGYDIGEASHPLTALAIPDNDLTVRMNLESRQLYRFWIVPYDKAGNCGKRVYIKNAYQA